MPSARRRSRTIAPTSAALRTRMFPLFGVVVRLHSITVAERRHFGNVTVRQHRQRPAPSLPLRAGSKADQATTLEHTKWRRGPRSSLIPSSAVPASWCPRTTLGPVDPDVLAGLLGTPRMLVDPPRLVRGPSPKQRQTAAHTELYPGCVPDDDSVRRRMVVVGADRVFQRRLLSISVGIPGGK